MPRVRRCREFGCHAMAMMPNHYCSKHIAKEKEYQAKKEYFKKHKYSNPVKTRYYNQVTRKRNSVKREQNKFYHSAVWSRLRAIVIDKQYGLCQYCKARGILNEGNVVDHVVPVEAYPEKMKDLDNLVVCCTGCHYWKTRWEEKYYGTGLYGKPTHNSAISDVNLIAKLSGQLKDEKTRERK
ncbi:HNH endonuclease [Lactobacillus sp.]|uniref:HNH endonuclease n=1 Tax=Lactobacillus sp. TaxID=1591 RepID=UPI0019B0EF5B|nr:HNH endonuclease [Lactobacillus sp.]MBD5429700.1 HNH endonuclease [Lactobacillus sp.]